MDIATIKTGAILTVILPVVVAAILIGVSPAQPAKNVTLVYVGAENCAPCEEWQRHQGDAFRRSAEFSRLTYRELESPSLLDVLKDDNWPEDLRSYRRAIGGGAGVPLWLVIADDRLVMQGFGARQWQEKVLPKIRSLLDRRVSFAPLTNVIDKIRNLTVWRQ